MTELVLRRSSSILGWLAAAVILIYAVANLALYVWQRDLIYHPFGRSASPAAVGVPEMRVLRVRTKDGLTVSGWYAPAPPGMPTVVLYHGNTGTLAMRAFKARLFLDGGYGVWLAGYRGFDGNPGWPSERGLYADARAVLDWLALRGTGADEVVLYGESLGTGVAVQMATERAVAGLILEAPFTSIPDVAELRYPLMPVHWLAEDRFDSLSKMEQVAAPLLIVHGGRDAIVPVGMARRLAERATGPKEAAILPQAGHIDLFDWGAGGIIVDFLHRHAAAPLQAAAE